MDTNDAAQHRWVEILTAFGVSDEFLKNEHGPCPIHGGHRPFRFDDKEGRGTWICSRCGAGNGWSLLRELFGWEFREAAKRVDEIIGHKPEMPEKTVKEKSDERQKLDAIKRLLSQSLRVEPGDPVSKYLDKRCSGYDKPALRDLWHHPGLAHPETGVVYPAMLAVVRSHQGEGLSVHRTWLTEDGSKAPVDTPKMLMPGKPIRGGGILIGPTSDYFVVAEGIETAICARVRYVCSAYSTINASGMASWIPPKGTRTVIIAADNDFSYTGQQAAFTLAKRLVLKGIDVAVRISPRPDSDWADFHRVDLDAIIMP